MNWAHRIDRVFDGAKLSDFPDCSVKRVSLGDRKPVFGTVQFVLPAPESKFNLTANTCYRCSATATHSRNIERRFGIGSIYLARSHKRLGSVATCAEHSQGPLRLVADLRVWNSECSQLTVLTESPAFVREIVDLVRQTNVVRPPWITFPTLSPFIGWNGAVEGSWIREVWAPHWRSLSMGQRADIVAENPPPETWHGWEKSLSWEFML